MLYKASALLGYSSKRKWRCGAWSSTRVPTGPSEAEPLACRSRQACTKSLNSSQSSSLSSPEKIINRPKSFGEVLSKPETSSMRSCCSSDSSKRRVRAFVECISSYRRHRPTLHKAEVISCRRRRRYVRHGRKRWPLTIRQETGIRLGSRRLLMDQPVKAKPIGI